MPRQHTATTTPRFRLSAWRVVTWLLALLAVFGIFQYSVHGWHVLAGLRAAHDDDTHAALAGIMSWDIAYLAAACITLAVAAGALFRRGWARPVLRVVAVLLALWLLVTAIMLARHWMSFDHHSQMLLAQSHLGQAGHELVARIQRRFLVGVVLKAVCVPILAWLAWRLGVPKIRAQFPVPPARKPR